MQTESRPPESIATTAVRRRDQPSGQHPLEQLFRGHGPSLGAADSGGADDEQLGRDREALQLDLPIGSKASRSRPSIAPATRSVTRTSPARARLTTRWARLTWLPK